MTKMRIRILPTGCVLLIATALSAQAKPASNGIAWRTSLSTASQDAKRTGKPIMVDLWATWCGPCRAMDERTYSSLSVIRESRKWVPLKIDIDVQPKIAEKFGLKMPPMVVFMKPDGSVINKVTGYADAPAMLKQMKAAYPKVRKQSDRAAKGVAR